MTRRLLALVLTVVVVIALATAFVVLATPAPPSRFSSTTCPEPGQCY